VNIDAAGQLAFIVHVALGGDHLSATKTYRIEDVVYELMRSSMYKSRRVVLWFRANDLNTRYASTTRIPTTERFNLFHHELGFRRDRLLKPSSTFCNGSNKGGKQLEELANAETRCNWSREAILAALGAVQRLGWAGV
jgi:hypothetical protein